MVSEWRFTVDALPAGQWPARVSIPTPQGEGSGKAYAVRRPDGSVTPAQARALTAWPDGSPRWVQLDFQANGPGECTAMEGSGDTAAALPVSAWEEGGAYTVSVGRLQATLDPARGTPTGRIVWDGRELASSFGAFRVADEGLRYYTPVGARSVTVEASGPNRFQLSWETEHRDAAGNTSLSVRFRVEFLAGVEGFVLSYQFFHKLPGHDYLHLREIKADFALPALAGGHGVVVQESYSSMGQRRAARLRNTVPILVDNTQACPYVESLASLGDDYQYPFFFNSAYTVAPHVALEGDGVAMIIAPRSLEDQRPKTVDVSPGIVSVGIWPERAGELMLPQGRSSGHQFAFLFTDAGPRAVDDLLFSGQAPYLEPALGWLYPADSAVAGPTWDAARLFTGAEPGAALFGYYLSGATHRYVLASGMFDFGDSPHAGYTQTYVSIGFRPRGIKPTKEVPMRAGLGSTAYSHLSRVPVETLEPVWANNEYDAIYGLALETLRTKSRANLRMLRAVSRHQIEVDFVHYSDHWQQHRGTPCHTYDHTACSTAYPSHQWTQGLYYYYCLTGDDDVPEVVCAICDFNLNWLAQPELQIMHYFNREIGWAIIALVFGYELTGDEKYRQAAKTLIEEMKLAAQREDFDELVKKSSSYVAQNEKQLGSNFAVNTILMGVCLYHKATGEEWAKDLLLRWVRIGFENYNDKSTGPKIVDMFSECFGYAYELTGDSRYLEASLWQLPMFMLGFNNPWGVPSAHAAGELDAKLYGRVYRGLAHYLSACAKAGLLPRVEKQFMGETAPV